MSSVEKEIEMLETEKASINNRVKIRWGEFISKRSLKGPIIISLGLHICQQFSGINAVIFYSTDIFESVGLKGNWPRYSTIILGIFQLIMTVFCMFTIEKIGRKKLLLIGFIGMSFSSFGLVLARVFGVNFVILILLFKHFFNQIIKNKLGSQNGGFKLFYIDICDIIHRFFLSRPRANRMASN